MDYAPLLFLAGIALVFWLLLVRPQTRRRRELAALHSSLEVGDEVMLTSGVFGTVRGFEEGADLVLLEVAQGVVLRVARGAVGQVGRDVPELHEDAETHPAPDHVAGSEKEQI